MKINFLPMGLLCLACFPWGVRSEPVSNESFLIQSIRREEMGKNRISQVTSVSELSDVQATDWAFTALQSLVERYGCIEGYPNKTYQGQRSLSRYEFAAGLNACLDKINEVISVGLSDKVSKDDLSTLQRLQEEFAGELAVLKQRVDSLDGKVATIEKQQFSTTTKLAGAVLFVPAFSTESVGGNVGRGNSSNLTFGARVRLNFNTSFSGSDLLRVRLQYGNVAGLNSANVGTNMTRLGFDEDTGGTFQLDDLWYRFPLSKNLTAFVGTNALQWDDVFQTISHKDMTGGDTGALARFNLRDPLLFRAPGSAGFALNFKASDQFGINVGYLAGGQPANPVGQAGLTNGAYSAGVQVVFKPVKELTLSAVYLRSFEPQSAGINLTAATGSSFGSNPFRQDTSADRYGFLFDWKIAEGLSLGANISFLNARSEAGTNRGNTADLLTWSVIVGLPNLFGPDHTGGIIFGQPPKVQSTSLATNPDGRGTSYNLEVFYKYHVSKKIILQPGVFFVFNPDHNSSNNTIVVGALRTIFLF